MKFRPDNLPFYYYVSDEIGILVDCNENFASALGFDKTVIIGKKLDNLFTIATRIFFQTHVTPLLKLKGAVSEIFITLRGNEGREISVLCNAQNFEEDGKTFTCYACMQLENRSKFEDELILARERAEKALQENTVLKELQNQLQANLEKTDRNLSVLTKQNEELRQFNHVVTHEMQEPIRKINIFSGLLTSDADKLSAVMSVNLDKLLRATERMRSVIDGLQRYSWLTEPDMQMAAINTKQLLYVVEQQLTSKYGDGALTIKAGILPDLLGEMQQIQLLFYHILDNSVQFRKAGNPATVEISGTIIHQNKFRFTPGKYDYKEYLRIEFKDDGIGIKPEYREHVFEFFKKLNQSPNTGMGLTLSKKIVENHGGKISIDGIPGGGTTIAVLLPLC